MPTPVPPGIAADATNLSDSVWVADVRLKLRDKPKPINGQWNSDGVGGAFGAAAAPLSLHSGPVYDGNPINTYVKVFDSTAPQAYTVITTGSPTGFQVLLDVDALTLTFATVPVTAHLMQVAWYTVKWTDAAIESALYAGLRQMFPSVGKTYVDTTITIAVNAWDYSLPTWAQSPDARVSKVEVRDLNLGVNPWRPLDNWTRVGIGLLHVPQSQRYAPGTALRVTGWGPYLSLGDLEPDLYNLPIWYAGSVLLPWQESFRIRQDTMVPATQEGGQSPGLLTQTGDYYQKRFDAELKQKRRAYGPPGTSRPILTTYQMARHV